MLIWRGACREFYMLVPKTLAAVCMLFRHSCIMAILHTLLTAGLTDLQQLIGHRQLLDDLQCIAEMGDVSLAW